MSYLCENEAKNIQNGYGYVAQEDAKCQKELNETMDNACPINPKKTLGLSVIYSMPTGRPVEGPNCPRFPTHRPMEWTLNNGTPVSNSGREN